MKSSLCTTIAVASLLYSSDAFAQEKFTSEYVLRVGSKISAGKKQNYIVIDVPSNYRFKITALKDTLRGTSDDVSEVASRDLDLLVLGAVVCSEDKPRCLRPEPNATVPLQISYDQWYTVKSNSNWQRRGISVSPRYPPNVIRYDEELFPLSTNGFFVFPKDAPEEKQYLAIGTPKHDPVIAYFSGVATGLATWFLYKGDVLEKTNSPTECEK